MRAITLPRTGVETTALGFGCAELYRAPSAARRRRLLEVAYGVGIRHFDLAPMYGLGLAERELGQFSRGRRDRIVIATKFGISPTAAARALARVQAPMRRVLSASPALRQRARSSAAGPASGRAGALLYSSTGYDAASARASLERSLEQLGTDYVDLLLLHDPEPGNVRSDEVCGYLEEARRAGSIRAWGVAGEPEPSLRVARSLLAGNPVLQVRDDIQLRSLSGVPTESFPARITFGVLGRALRPIVAHITAQAERQRQWSEAVGKDCGNPETIASLLLRHALRANPTGVVLFSTIRTDHMRSAAAVAASPGDAPAPDLDAFVRLVDTELHKTPSIPETDD